MASLSLLAAAVHRRYPLRCQPQQQHPTIATPGGGRGWTIESYQTVPPPGLLAACAPRHQGPVKRGAAAPKKDPVPRRERSHRQKLATLRWRRQPRRWPLTPTWVGTDLVTVTIASDHRQGTTPRQCVQRFVAATRAPTASHYRTTTRRRLELAGSVSDRRRRRRPPLSRQLSIESATEHHQQGRRSTSDPAGVPALRDRRAQRATVLPISGRNGSPLARAGRRVEDGFCHRGVCRR